MSISFSGLGSGLPIDEWIEKLVSIQQAKADSLTNQKNLLTQKQSALNTLKSEYSTVQSAATKFTDCLFGSSMDFFSKVGLEISGQNSDSPYITASVTQYATPSSLELQVKSLATSTVKRSNYFDAFKNSSNKLSELGVTNAGDFEINGATISIKPDMTIDSLVYQINNSTQAGVKASLKAGRLVLENKETGEKDLIVSGTDTVSANGDFAKLLGLDSDTNSITSKILQSGSNLSDWGINFSGQATINGQSYSFTPDTSIDDFIENISNIASSCSASLELCADGSYKFVSNDGSDINLELEGTTNSGGKNIFDVLGFTETKTSGTNAHLILNGERIVSSTNSISSEVSGVLGLSIDLKAVTTNKTLTLDISRNFNSDDPLKYMQDFIDAFNKIIVDTNTSTDSQNGGLLSGENTLVNIKTRLRSLITSPISNSGIYRSLADIGITSGAPGLDVDADTTQLILDKDKFLEAFKKDPNSVKSLLIGDKQDDVSLGNGLMQQIQENLTPALDSKYGYFYARTESLTSQMKSMDEKIEKKNEYITQYREKLTKQYNYMDNMIAKLNNQFSQMQQQLKSIGIDFGDS